MKRVVDALKSVAINIVKVIFVLPLMLFGLVSRLLWHFRVEGKDNIPEGNYIVLFPEISVLSNLAANWAYWQTLRGPLLNTPEMVQGYAQEALWSIPYFRFMMRWVADNHPLEPHAAGNLALGLIDGYRVLLKGGLVTMNPEGDMPFDGRPLPLGKAAAWLALRTGASLVPLVWSVDVYDIWPKWQLRPNLGGRVTLTVGEPFTVCDVPSDAISDKDIAAANVIIREQLDLIAYGEGGVAGWQGAPTLRGQPLVTTPHRLIADAGVRPHAVVPVDDVPIWRSGLKTVFWRCPVCHADDAIRHNKRPSRAQTMTCCACGTRWALRRVKGKDFRLELTHGHPDLVGLDMALSMWYDEMKRAFDPRDLPGMAGAGSVDLLNGEKVLLVASEATLAPLAPSEFTLDWPGDEPPTRQPPGQRVAGVFDIIGDGRVVLTDQRFIWKLDGKAYSFYWSKVTAVSLWMANVIGVRYGVAMYRLTLKGENGLKWLTYGGELARAGGAPEGHEVTSSYY